MDTQLLLNNKHLKIIFFSRLIHSFNSLVTKLANQYQITSNPILFGSCIFTSFSMTRQFYIENRKIRRKYVLFLRQYTRLTQIVCEKWKRFVLDVAISKAIQQRLKKSFCLKHFLSEILTKKNHLFLIDSLDYINQSKCKNQRWKKNLSKWTIIRRNQRTNWKSTWAVLCIIFQWFIIEPFLFIHLTKSLKS